MGAPKGFRPPNAGKGRELGSKNIATKDVRSAIAAFASKNVDRMGAWLDEIEQKDPAKAMDLYLRAIEYHIPKLQRTEVTGDAGGPIETSQKVELVGFDKVP